MKGGAELRNCSTGINHWKTSLKHICLLASHVTTTKFRALLDILSEIVLGKVEYIRFVVWRYRPKNRLMYF